MNVNELTIAVCDLISSNVNLFEQVEQLLRNNLTPIRLTELQKEQHERKNMQQKNFEFSESLDIQIENGQISSEESLKQSKQYWNRTILNRTLQRRPTYTSSMTFPVSKYINEDKLGVDITINLTLYYNEDVARWMIDRKWEVEYEDVDHLFGDTQPIIWSAWNVFDYGTTATRTGLNDMGITDDLPDKPIIDILKKHFGQYIRLS